MAIKKKKNAYNVSDGQPSREPAHVPEVLNSDTQEVEVRCGYSSCRPGILQKCNNPKVMVCVVSIYMLIQGFVVNGVTNVNIAPIERRFHLPSSKSAVIPSAYDFTAAIVGLFASYIGSGRCKPRWLTASAVVMAIASLIMAIPHFTTDIYQWGQGISSTCSLNDTSSLSDGICEAADLQVYQYVLTFGMVMYGVGGGILYTIGTAFIDDSVDAVDSPLYIGIAFTGGVLGPGIGYIVGGRLLDLYVDFDKVDTNSIPLSPIDPRWVGAWWLSYIIVLVLFIVIAVPLSCFGKEMPTAKVVRESRVTQLHNATSTVPVSVNPGRPRLRELPALLLSLIRNPAYFFSVLGSSSEAILILGLSTFSPKFMQTQFKLSSGRAALLAGAMTVIGAASGMLVGGIVCRRFRLKVRGILKYIIVVLAVATLACGMLWISCGQTNVAGISRSYPNSSSVGSLTTDCNEACQCTTEYYNPVCDGNGVEYFSPCHAGCMSRTENGYQNCSCVAHMETEANVTMVTRGRCDGECSLLIVFCVMFFVMVFTTFNAYTPNDIVMLRCIQENHRSVGIGVNRCFIRILGAAIGPVLYGAFTDAACLVWQTECGENSSCWIYDNFVLSRNYFIISIVCRVVSIVFFSLALYFYKPPKGEDLQTANGETDSTRKEAQGNKDGTDTTTVAAFDNVVFDTSKES